jgi:hypothetical protein
MPTRPDISGQGELSGLEGTQPISLSEQLSFVGALRYPTNWGVYPIFLGEEQRHHMELMSPEKIRPSLIDVKNPPRRTAVSMPDPETGRGIFIALTPQEYIFIARSPAAIGEEVLNRTLAARTPYENPEKSFVVGRRSQAHTAEGYIDKMDVYIKDTLEVDIKRLEEFREYVSNPQLRRLRGDNLKLRLEWIRGHIFEDMIVAMRTQRRWTKGQEKMAREALDYRLFLDRDNNQYLHNWQEMFALAQEYTGYKWALFKTKQHQLRRFQKRN